MNGFKMKLSYFTDKMFLTTLVSCDLLFVLVYNITNQHLHCPCCLIPGLNFTRVASRTHGSLLSCQLQQVVVLFTGTAWLKNVYRTSLVGQNQKIVDVQVLVLLRSLGQLQYCHRGTRERTTQLEYQHQWSFHRGVGEIAGAEWCLTGVPACCCCSASERASEDIPDRFMSLQTYNTNQGNVQ